MDSMKRSILFIAVLLLTAAQGALAQVVVSSESELNTAIGTNNVTSIVLASNVLLSSYLDINGKTLSINLNGYKLYRSISGDYSSTGHVIYVHNNAKLTLTNSEDKGSSIEGGKALNGGAMFIEPGSTVIASNVTFQNNTASVHGGAIWNAGSFTATGCNFKDNTAYDVGGFYNAIAENTYCGTATFTNCTFSGNTGTSGCGALGNATGNTSLTLNNCDVHHNVAGTNGGGVWNGGTLTITSGKIHDNFCAVGYNGAGIYQIAGTLNMSGNPYIGDNNRREGSDSVNNVYLGDNQVITVTGAFSGAKIGIAINDSHQLYYTSGFSAHNPGVAPAAVFTSDHPNHGYTLLEGEIIRFDTKISLTSTYLKEDGTMVTQAGCNKLSYFSDNESGLGGIGLENGWFVVDQATVTFNNRIEIIGTVNLILSDNSQLDAKKGIHVPYNATLHIWAQRSGQESGTGELKANVSSGTGAVSVANIPNVAGIGENRLNIITGERTGEMFFHGGVIAACGGSNAPGIGGHNGKDITITGGSVLAVGGENAAGIGSGYFGVTPKNIIITGGNVLAFGIVGGAGIGSGRFGFTHVPRNGSSHAPDGEGLHTIRITGGDVRALGAGAGIGGGDGGYDGYDGCAGKVYIDGGTVYASTLHPASGQNNFAYSAQAIGHGSIDPEGSVSNFYMDGVFSVYPNAKVVAKKYYGSSETNVLAANRMAALHWAEVTISPCDHPMLSEGEACPYCGGTGLWLSDGSDNGSIIRTNDGNIFDVTISGRTLWKDGSWNTLCLPFALSDITGTPLAGATIKTLTGATFSDGVLTLTFGEAVTAIEAGKPYIVRWNSGENVTDPVFRGVTVRDVMTNRAVGSVTFFGTYCPVGVFDANHTKLYLGADNKLYYATSALNVNSFRGYFVLSGNVQPNAVSSLVLDFGEEPTGELNIVEE